MAARAPLLTRLERQAGPTPARGYAERVANALAQETSPYLRQHADNPVDWLPWGPEALARARELDRPLLVSIGYSACHWCHVMERESFEDAAHRGADERAASSASRSTARSAPTSTPSTWRPCRG